jgi:NAD(P)H dehydrogenase (quinone)
MVKILVIYATDYGNTKAMAESVVKGVKSVSGVEAVLRTAEETTAEDFLQCDGAIVGSPVHMGSPDWRIKKMIDTVCSGLWMKDKLIGKVGGVFTSGGGFGNAGGGCELTMLALLNNFAELGFIIVPLPKNTPGYPYGGIQWGPYGRSADVDMKPTGVSEESLQAAFHHGANIARVAKVMRGQEVFAKAERMKNLA